MTSTADEKDAIRELMARYCHALDACKFSEVASLFAEDAVQQPSGGACPAPALPATLSGSGRPLGRVAVSVAHAIPRRPGVLPGSLWRFLGDRCFANGRRLLRHRSLSGG